MNNQSNFSRRGFIKSSMMATAIAGTATFSDCTPKNTPLPHHTFLGDQDNPDGIKGLLFSQLGYELGLPVRVIIRLPERNYLSDSAMCQLISHDGKVLKSKCQYWGDLWGSHWWIAEFKKIIKEDTWQLQVFDAGKAVLVDEGLRTARQTLWDQTIEYSSVDMLERRKHFTKVGAGWQDAGTLWVESCAQSAMIISLAELLEKSSQLFDQKFINRIEEQIINGCDYLVMTQKKAKELGYADGSFTHDLHGHEHDILPNDANKAVVALMMASRLLSDMFIEKKKEYLKCGEKAYQWLIKNATPMGDYGYHTFQRGIPSNTTIPPDEWLTRDLVMMCWASLEKWKIDQKESTKQRCINYAKKVMDRQIPKEKPENGYYGHFYEFDTLTNSENTWIHGIIIKEITTEFGADLGGFYPNYLIPIIEMIRLWPELPTSNVWSSMLKDFSEGYLKPACNANPFKIVPLGIFGDEGPIWFGGTFHGSNAIYGYTAALAFELSELLEDDELKDIAYHNLQWIAGLNSGITKESVKTGCVVFSTEIPNRVALPASMICHIGNRWAGSWFQTKGIICNGFSVGEQFVYDAAPTTKNDGPFSFTDEDWIPHSSGWIAGLIRLNKSINA